MLWIEVKVNLAITHLWFWIFLWLTSQNLVLWRSQSLGLYIVSPNRYDTYHRYAWSIHDMYHRYKHAQIARNSHLKTHFVIQKVVPRNLRTAAAFRARILGDRLSEWQQKSAILHRISAKCSVLNGLNLWYRG